MEKITAILPVKNASSFAEAIIRNLKENCTSGDEILVINDFSTDDTNEIFARLIGGDFRFKIIQNKTPGLSNALNLGIQIASHEWIARFDCDDRYSENRLDTQRKLLSAEVACVFSDYSVHDENLNFLTKIPSPIFDACTKLSLIKNSRTPHPSVIFNKQKAILAGGYRYSEFPAEDLGLWLRMSTKGEFLSAPEILLQYTIRRNSVTSEKQLEMIDVRNSLIHNSTIFQDVFETVDRNWRRYFTAYDSYNDTFERKLLLLSDFFNVGREFKLHYLKTALLMSLNLIRDLKWPYLILKLLRAKYKLKSIRNSKAK